MSRTCARQPSSMQTRWSNESVGNRSVSCICLWFGWYIIYLESLWYIIIPISAESDNDCWTLVLTFFVIQNNNGKFRVSKSLCLAINNIDHVLQYIQPFVQVSSRNTPFCPCHHISICLTFYFRCPSNHIFYNHLHKAFRAEMFSHLRQIFVLLRSSLRSSF